MKLIGLALRRLNGPSGDGTDDVVRRSGWRRPTQRETGKGKKVAAEGGSMQSAPRTRKTGRASCCGVLAFDAAGDKRARSQRPRRITAAADQWFEGHVGRRRSMGRGQRPKEKKDKYTWGYRCRRVPVYRTNLSALAAPPPRSRAQNSSMPFAIRAFAASVAPAPPASRGVGELQASNVPVFLLVAMG